MEVILLFHIIFSMMLHISFCVHEEIWYYILHEDAYSKIIQKVNSAIQTGTVIFPKCFVVEFSSVLGSVSGHVSF